MESIGAVALTFKNIRQRPVRNGILVLCVAAVVGLLTASQVVELTSKGSVQTSMARLGADLIAVPRDISSSSLQALNRGNVATFYMRKGLEEKIRGFDFVAKTSPQLYIRSLSSGSCCSAWSTYLIGFDPASDFTVQPWLAKNRQLGPAEVLIGAAVQSAPGSRLTFFGTTFTAAGQLEPTRSGIDKAVFIPMAAARAMIRDSARRAEQPLSIDPEYISAVLIQLKPEGQGGVPSWKAAMELERDIWDIAIVQPADMVKKMQASLESTLAVLYAASCITWPVTALLIGLVFTMAVQERRREIGLLRAMGARRWFVFRIIMLEAVLVTAAGTVAGGGIAAALIRWFAGRAALLGKSFMLPSAAEVAQILALAAAAAVLTGIVAALAPALRASLREPYESMRRVD